MKIRDIITEQTTLPPEQAEPLKNTFVIPGLSAADPYKNYRFGVAMARARSDLATDNVNNTRPEWSAETAFGEHAVIVGFSNNVDPVIDAALKMTKTPGGKHLVSTAQSEEPKSVDTKSPIKAFKGYPR